MRPADAAEEFARGVAGPPIDEGTRPDGGRPLLRTEVKADDADAGAAGAALELLLPLRALLPTDAADDAEAAEAAGVRLGPNDDRDSGGGGSLRRDAAGVPIATEEGAGVDMAGVERP